MNIRDRILHAILKRLFDFRDIVKNVDGKDVLYMRRYYVRRSKRPHIFIHFIALSDMDRDLHDHPWSFKSRILIGGYTEETFNGNLIKVENSYRRETQTRHYGVGAVIERDAEFAHRLVLDGGRPVWTLVTASEKERLWGFYFDGVAWVPWFEYLSCADAASPKQDART